MELKAEQSDDKHSVSRYNNVVEIKGPYNTHTVYSNLNKHIQYFDTESLVLSLANMFTIQRFQNVYVINGDIETNRFKITLNTKDCCLQMVNLCYNITDKFNEYVIKPCDYPIYQYTENPAIVMLAYMLAICYMDIQYLVQFMSSMIRVSGKIIPNENYYIDENTILLLSIYYEKEWINVTKIIELSEYKIKQLSDEREQIEIAKASGDDMHQPHGQGMYVNINTRLKKIRTLTNNYIRVQSFVKSLKDTDKVLELKFGNASHFLIQRNDNIMTIEKDEYKSIKYNPLNEKIIDLYRKCHAIYNKKSEEYNQMYEEYSCNDYPVGNDEDTFMPYY